MADVRRSGNLARGTARREQCVIFVWLRGHITLSYNLYEQLYRILKQLILLGYEEIDVETLEVFNDNVRRMIHQPRDLTARSEFLQFLHWVDTCSMGI